MIFGTASRSSDEWRYMCPHCGVPRRTPTICPECDARLDAEEQARAEERRRQQRQAKAQRALEYDSLGKRLDDASFEGWEHRRELERLYRDCRDYVDNWIEHKRDGHGLILAGTNGTGKSYLAAAIKNAIEQQGDVAVFISVPDLGGKIRATWDRERGAPTEQEVFDVMLDVDLLILDDLGAETARPSMEEQLYRIVDGRYRNMKPIIVTANVQPRDIELRFGSRIADRLAETCDVLVSNAKSYRKMLAERRATQ